MKTRVATRGSRGEAPPSPDRLGAGALFEHAKYLVSSSRPSASENRNSTLTRAERAVVGRVIAGDSNVEIARRRGTSPRTVANQLATIFRKLGTRSRWELIAHGRGPSSADLRALTKRERQVVGFVVLGRSNKLIGYDLGLSPGTIAVVLSRAMSKLGVRSRAQLVSALSSSRAL